MLAGSPVYLQFGARQAFECQSNLRSDGPAALSHFGLPMWSLLLPLIIWVVSPPGSFRRVGESSRSASESAERLVEAAHGGRRPPEMILRLRPVLLSPLTIPISGDDHAEMLSRSLQVDV